MKRLLAGLLAMALLVACGGTRTQADQQKDGTMLAGALRTADLDGATFKLDQQLLIMGGDIPTGQAFQLHATASSGVLRDGAAQFGYHIQQGQQANDYDMRVVDGRLYVRRRGASAWKATPVGNTTTLFPALRLDVLRETVLLASSVSTGGLGHVDAGFARKYAVRPAADQVEQLLSLSVQGTAEQQFLKSATAEVDVFMTVPDSKVGRVEVHVRGVDPSNGEQQQIQSSLDLRSAKVAAVQAPSDAQLVAASDILA
jgi:uncharacterized protein YaiE (UPF0345 family)